MNCGRDLSSTMYGMKRIDDDVFIFVTYHKEESTDEQKNYVDGKPDYADAFEDNMISDGIRRLAGAWTAHMFQM